MNQRDIPELFRKHGFLWWFQLLSTYLIRIAHPLANQLKRHPAMAELLTQHAEGATTQWHAACRAALRESSSMPVGWMPLISYDVGLQIRMGDACGPRAQPQPARKCVHSLLAALKMVDAHHLPADATVFLASDSTAIFEQAGQPDALSLPFKLHYLHLDRNKYDFGSNQPGDYIEVQAGSNPALTSDLFLEALMDLLLLSRASILAGSMMSNLPRLALQMHITQPGEMIRRMPYITLDGRDWCSGATCANNNSAGAKFWR